MHCEVSKYVRTCLVSDRCLKKTFEKRRTAGMYSNTSMISTVEGGERGEGMEGKWEGKEGSELRGSEVRGGLCTKC